MSWLKPKHYSREVRCNNRENCQPVPGDFSFRQEWPLDYCDEVECESENQTDRENDELDECCGTAATEKVADPDLPGPLRIFDDAVRGFLQTDNFSQESPPKSLQRNLHPRLLARQTQGVLDTTEGYISGDSSYWEFAKKLAQIEKHFVYEQALLAAEGAADAAPPELAEEAALASAKGYTMSLEADKKTERDGDCLVEVVSFLGITKPKPDRYFSC